MPKKTSQLPWEQDKQLDLLLLKLVIEFGLHLLEGKTGVNKKWSELYDSFFKAPEALSYQEEHYTNWKGSGDSFRRLKDRFNYLRTNCNSFMFSGNKSKEGGNKLSRKYRLIECIEKEIEEEKEEKKKKDQTKQKMDGIEHAILVEEGKNKAAKRGSDEDNSTFIKRKKADGTYEFVEVNKAKPPPKPSSAYGGAMSAFDKSLMSFLKETSPAAKQKQNVEQQSEDRLNLWIQNHNKVLSMFLEEAKITDEVEKDEFEDIGLEILVSIYCTRNADFSKEIFMTDMRKMVSKSVMELSLHKIYRQLQKWRILCEEEETAARTAMQASLDEELALSSALSAADNNIGETTPSAVSAVTTTKSSSVKKGNIKIPLSILESSDTDDNSDDSGESRNRVQKTKDNGDDDSSVGDADEF